MGSNHQSLMISFGPMFCLRPSPSCKGMIREYCDGVSVYKKKCHMKEFREPASPRVGCMGQIKRDKVGTLSGAKTNKFVKLKKIFSSKNLTTPDTSTSTFQGNCAVPVGCIAGMDPPLPVPKHVFVKDCNAVSLWKRRCGQKLESLHLQPLPFPHTTN